MNAILRFTMMSLLLAVAAQAYAQFDYGNAWYAADPGQVYVKLKIAQDGVYRVTAQDLADVGYSLSGVDAQDVRLFYRGAEQRRYVSVTQGGQIRYVEFFGRRNDGQLDSLMYRSPGTGILGGDMQPNKHQSLFTDTAAYFLSWSPGDPGLGYFSYTDVVYSALTPEPFFRYESRIEANPNDPSENEYILGGGGQYDSFNTLNSDYVTGEGYVFRRAFGLNQPAIFTLPTPGALSTGRPVRVQARVFGRSQTFHWLRIELNNTPPSVLDTVINNQWVIYTKTYTRWVNANLSRSTDLRFSALQINSNHTTDNNHLCWAGITYDRICDLENGSRVRIHDFAKTNNAYFRFINADGADSVFVYDLTDGVRSAGVMSGRTAQVIVPFFNTAGPRQLFLTTDKGIMKPVISPHSLNNLSDPSNGADFVIITHRKLAQSAAEYERYRDSARVNPLDARVVYVDEIYDEFGYGSVTPWAIKRFCKYAMDNWSVKPQYFLLWGKGKYRTRKDLNGADPDNLVPTYGYPASDHAFVGQFDPGNARVNTQAAIGRVNVLNNRQGMDYLRKVMQYEYSPFLPWMKRGVFLGGGATVGEQRAIEDAMQYVIGLFEGKPLGGEATYFQKKTQSLLDPASAAYHNIISDGAAIIHFFGHSSSNLQDISIKEAYEYNNFGRYPFMVAKGCYGGDFTGNDTLLSFGERWIIEPRRGAIGYLANSSAGYLNPLRDYARIFYQMHYGPHFGGRVGDAIMATLNKYADSIPGIQTRNHARQMNLQGDPAVRIYFPKLPDLEITQSSVFFTPENFTAQDDSFRLNLIVRNNGLATSDSVVIRIVQRLPNGQVVQYDDRIVPMVCNRDTFAFTLANPASDLMAGRNVFEITVDADDEIEEYLENNNFVSITRIVPGNIPATLFPAEYAIVRDDRIHLDASAFFMTREQNVRYIFEIDTDAEFTSNSKVVSPIITGTATYARWDVPFSLQDSMVYYWRVRLVDKEPSIWGSSSFKYIAGKTGWAQSQMPQFIKNESLQVTPDVIQDEWLFGQLKTQFTFEMAPVNGNYFLNMSINSQTTAGERGGNRLFYAIIDSRTLETLHRPLMNFNLVQNIDNPPADLYKLTQAIQTAKTGDYVFLCATGSPQVSQWNEALFTALRSIGVSEDIRDASDTQPFMVMGRKGYPNSALEVYQPNSGNKLLIDAILATNHKTATVNSTRIGPSTRWDDMFWRWSSSERPLREGVSVDVYGVRADNSDSLVIEGVTNLGITSLRSVDAKRFPFLRLSARMADSVNYTAPQLEHWHVLYEPAPDAVVDPVTGFVFQSDTLQEGQDVYIKMGAVNVTSIGMDSLKVRFVAIRGDRSRLMLDTIRVAPLPAGGRVDFDYRFNTLEKKLVGNVNLQVEINPDFDQPEQHSFNNFYTQAFRVEEDKRNPLLDVTVDGKRIMDGDIVSPRPEILIEINDENPYIAVSDSDAFELFFKEDSPIIPFERIPVSGRDARVNWSPATLPENKARVRFYPGQDRPLKDGEYVLRVQGKDQKGNVAGENGAYYETHFRVVNDATITQVFNYPNPFSTATRFVFTLTGNELPSKFQVHIYTISGKLVRVIDLLASGDVSIGRNITNFAWDGTDQFGDRLDNGVYLYRVVSEMAGGEELKLREENTSQYFSNGWGKMYLMR